MDRKSSLDQTEFESPKIMGSYVAMFLVGFSLFLYEVLLTRLFSVILSFNLVFLVVSFAILGSGIGGILAYRMLNNKGLQGRDLLIKYILWIPVSIILSTTIIYYIPFIPVFTVYALIGAVPFIFGGIVISILFQENPQGSHKLYFFDLMGSALGSLGVLYFMNKLGFLSSVIIVCIGSFLAAMSIYKKYHKKGKMMTSGMAIVLLVGALFQGNFIQTIERNFISYYTSPNTVIYNLRKAVEGPLDISFSKWDGISRTDVLEGFKENEKIIVTDGGASAPITKFDGNLASIEELKKSVNYIPFIFGKNNKTLVIGAGGGKDVLFALLGESEEVHAVEINPSTIAAVNYFKDFSGDIYNRDGVDVHVQDGRNFIENSQQKYDNIYLSMVMTNAIENTMYSLSESYIYTVEAFEEYLDHLNKNGKLSFMMHDTMDLTKMINTGIKVLLDKGVPQEEVTDYFVVVNGADPNRKMDHGDNISMPLVIFKNEPFTMDEINAITTAAKDQKKGMIHYPGRESALYKLLKDKELSYDELLEKIQFNGYPITDNSPFFYNYSKFLPVEIQFVFLGTLAVWMTLRSKYVKGKRQKQAARYFMGLGLAYMLVEIPIIQKMVLYFGNPSLAFSMMLFSLLLSSGLGSALSGSKKVEKIIGHSSLYLLVTAVSIAVVQFNLNRIMDLTIGMGIAGKFFIGFITILPMGLLMGIPFATGIRKLREVSEETDVIPLMWGINGIFSVLGSVLAIIISMKFGFNMTIYAGALIYLILYMMNPLRIENDK